MQKYVKNTYKYQKIARVLCLIIPRAVIDMFSITVYSIDFFFTSICITLRKDHNILKFYIHLQSATNTNVTSFFKLNVVIRTHINCPT